MRSYVAQLLRDDAELRELGLPQDSVYAGGTLDSPRPRPFLTLRWAAVARGVVPRAPTTISTLDVLINDAPGDYARIDRLSLRVRELLTSLRAQPTETGMIGQVRWRGDGDDTADDVFQTIYRAASFDIVGRGR